MDPKLYEISDKSEIIITHLENLYHLQNLVSTEEHFERLVISIEATIKSEKQLEKDYLEDLINIKYMKLTELVIRLEMSTLKDKHMKILAEALEKNRSIKILSLNFWKYHIYNLAIK